jgi:glycosyltransferase involved in cell wall biosynthesis
MGILRMPAADMYQPANCLLPDVTLIGYPLGWTGRAEHVRAVGRALDAAGIRSKVYNAGGYDPADDRTDVEFLSRLTDQLPPGIRIYSLNGNEVHGVLEALETRQGGSFQSGYNIVFPAWELPRYPEAWARELDRFDEIWTASPFADQSIRAATRVPVVHLPNACEPHISEMLERSNFGISSDRFVVLFFFDVSSYTARKNPWAVIEAFRRLVTARPSAPVQLVVKLNNSSHQPGVVEKIRAETVDLGNRVAIIDATLKSNEVKNLVRCCDCFLSLHRSEGFGRGPAEAMFFGKPVIATGWSGNMEYMNSEVAFPVGYQLIPVNDGEYLEGQNQFWADPDIGHAARILVRLVDDPGFARATGERARNHMRMNYSDIAIGKRYRARLEAIVSGNRALPAFDSATPPRR